MRRKFDSLDEPAPNPPKRKPETLKPQTKDGSSTHPVPCGTVADKRPKDTLHRRPVDLHFDIVFPSFLMVFT